uniref:Fibronectin type-III domain-containing protein n=1 Tax=Pygocentrus nattereri TaxID=42514 RepID=A0AAR2IL91_PYGNA
MMTDQMLELPPLLNGEVPMMHHMINGDASQQVILVQVNPGETFTIRREDGTLQCIQGPAEVPMMSPNGSIPPIHVPPGYISQDNTGVRRVVVTPHSECYPPSYSPALSPTHHLPPPYMTHPHFIPASHTAYYPPASPGDVPPHQYYQHRLPPIYPEGKPAQSCSSSRCRSTTSLEPNLLLSFHLLNGVFIIQARSALVSWSRAPVGASGRGQTDGAPLSCSYELLLADKSCDGKYRVVYSGEELQYTLTDLRPATDYHVRVSAVCNSVKGPHSEARAFTTHSAPPETPLPPRLSHRTKSSLTLQWKPPVDNGSKITNYVLEWDEGKKNSVFRECYFGYQRHFKVMRLCPAVGYTFRVAALNDIGPSGFSPEVVFHTTGSLPQMPLAPRLLQAGTSWVALEWTRPSGCSPDEAVTYTLEMQDDSKVTVVLGPKLHISVTALSTWRSRTKTGLIAEWRSTPSSVLMCRTSPDKPGPPAAPRVSAVTPHSFCVAWVTSFNSVVSYRCCAAVSQWEIVYRGPLQEHVCKDLNTATRYSLRLSSNSSGGHSQSLLVCTLSLPPGPCRPVTIQGSVKHREVNLQWEGPAHDGDDESLVYSVEMSGSEEESDVMQVYHGAHTECTVGSLLPGATYRFRVRAANDAGYGPFTEFLEVTTAAGPPGQCVVPVISLTSHTCAVVSWESSGADISGYRLDWGRDQDSLEMVYSGTETFCEISNLEAAASYCCRLQATNQAGAGPYSDLAWCRMPAAAPEAVVNLYLQEPVSFPAEGETFSPSTCLALAWDEPNSNGQEITCYTIAMGDTVITAGNTTCHVIRNLQPDSEYRAENAVGAGPFGPSLRVRTRPLPPAPPRLECAAAGPQSLKLRWGDSNSRGPSTDETTFILQMEDRNQRFVPIYRGPSHTFKVQRLSESSRYTFRIQAVSEAGEGPFSDMYSFTTAKSVPPTLKAPRVAQLEGNACEVAWENVPPMRGDRISYVLQVLGGRESEYRQVYKGEDTTFQLFGLQWNTDYRLRVFVCRRCSDTSQELCGSFSPSTHFSPRRSNTTVAVEPGTVSTSTPKALTDEQFASLIVLGVASLSIFIAYLLQLLI